MLSPYAKMATCVGLLLVLTLYGRPSVADEEAGKDDPKDQEDTDENLDDLFLNMDLDHLLDLKVYVSTQTPMTVHETPGIVIMRNRRKMKIARGMASAEAAADRAARDDQANGWDQWGPTQETTAAEGVQAPVPYRGSAGEVLHQLLAGLRSGMGYCDAKDVQQMWRNARFVRQTEAGVREAGPHDLESF